jgi:hypothetical protein
MPALVASRCDPLRRFGSGNNGTNTAHCSSLNNACRFFIEEAMNVANGYSPTLRPTDWGNDVVTESLSNLLDSQ